jgi:hypothetical protein
MNSSMCPAAATGSAKPRAPVPILLSINMARHSPIWTWWIFLSSMAVEASPMPPYIAAMDGC